MVHRKDYEGVFNPYSFQIDHYDQLPEDIVIEVLNNFDEADISEIPVNIINDWLQQEAEIWNWTDGVTYE